MDKYKEVNGSETDVKVDKKKEILRVVKYTLVAISAGIIQIGTFTLFTEVFGWSDWWISYLPSLILSVLWNFTINRKYTFKSANNVPVAMVKVAIYYLIFTPLSLWLGDWLNADLRWNTYIVEVLIMALNFVTEFIYQRFFVFRDSIDSAVKVDDLDTTNDNR